MKRLAAVTLLAVLPQGAPAQPFYQMAEDPWPTVYALMESQDCWASQAQLLELFTQVFRFPTYQTLDYMNQMGPNADLEYSFNVDGWRLMTGPTCTE